MKKTTDFLAPISGKLLDISRVPDEVFADRVMGDGFAVDIDGKQVVAPVDGVVESIFPGGHAICIQGDNGMQILIHIGLETHTMSNLYDVMVIQGQRVKAGDLLVLVNYKKIRKYAKSSITPIVFLHNEKVKLLKENHAVTAKEANIVEVEMA